MADNAGNYNSCFLAPYRINKVVLTVLRISYLAVSLLVHVGRLELMPLKTTVNMLCDDFSSTARILE
jgi:hypothetical protein